MSYLTDIKSRREKERSAHKLFGKRYVKCPREIFQSHFRNWPAAKRRRLKANSWKSLEFNYRTCPSEKGLFSLRPISLSLSLFFLSLFFSHFFIYPLFLSSGCGIFLDRLTRLRTDESVSFFAALCRGSRSYQRTTYFKHLTHRRPLFASFSALSRSSLTGNTDTLWKSLRS